MAMEKMLKKKKRNNTKGTILAYSIGVIFKRRKVASVNPRRAMAMTA